ncbi:hypothetical protein J2Y03_001201 [Neobacillus niacini]|nr:hypothetical protein [Neobacillus niacini]
MTPFREFVRIGNVLGNTVTNPAENPTRNLVKGT